MGLLVLQEYTTFPLSTIRGELQQPERPVFGCVTNGQLWLFMRLVADHIEMGNRYMYIGDLGRLLGVFRAIIEEYDRATPPAG